LSQIEPSGEKGLPVRKDKKLKKEAPLGNDFALMSLKGGAPSGHAHETMR